MPGLDGTGPRGMGPLMGGGRGFCGYYGVPIAPVGTTLPNLPVSGQSYPAPVYPLYKGAGRDRGFGRGRGFGRCRGRLL